MVEEGELQRRIHAFLTNNSFIGEQEKFSGSFERSDLFKILDEAKQDILEGVFGVNNVPYLLVGDGTIVIDTRNAEEKLATICRRILKWFGEKP